MFAPRNRGRTRAAALFLIAAVLLSSHADRTRAAASEGVESPRKLTELARIDLPPSLAPRRLLSLQPQTLPDGWRAHLPARDGDLFVAAASPVPRPSVTVDEVRREVVEPILAGLGCTDVRLEGPPHEVRPTRADASRLARAMRVPDGVGGRPSTKSLAGIAADLERQLVVYPFKQVLGARAIEPGGVVVTRWEGQSPSAVRGSVICFPHVENVAALSPPEVTQSAIAMLQTELRTRQVEPLEAPRPVLLIIGTDAEGRTRLRHAYGLTVAVEWDDQTAVARLWIDAEHGDILALDPLPGLSATHPAQSLPRLARVRALVWKRDPGVGTMIAEFDVDDPGPAGYMLARAGIMARVGDHDGPLVSSIGPDFAHHPLDDWRKAICNGANTSFPQLNAAAAILRSYDVAAAQGLLSPMPWVWKPAVGGRTCGAGHGMKFEHCNGYFLPRCPAGHEETVSDDGPTGRRNLLSWAQDNTVVAHESAHTLIPLLTHFRRADWCGQAGCTMPSLWVHRLHDLADFWADHLEWTNCFGGWVGRNLRGPRSSRNCRRHSESSWLPRLHDVRGDHYPEHRALHGGDEYADGQIAAAALWDIRAGMLSVGGAAGVAQFGVRFQRGLTLTGLAPLTIDSSDAALYRIFYDLHAQLADQWATSLSGTGGAQTLNKVTSGFARVGLFLIPYQCLDGDPSTIEPMACPGRDHGGDAVVDVDDLDPSDDPRAEGVSHRETDYVKRWGRAPLFRVWTGPRYWFDPAGHRRAGAQTPPCNTRFLVEISTSRDFRAKQTLASGWRRAESCYGTWRPSAVQWRTLQSSRTWTRVFYRARTDAGWAGSERLSTEPGAGLWIVPAPYAVITADGRPPY